MKKWVLCFIACAVLSTSLPFTVNATESVFKDKNAFSVAKSAKLGLSQESNLGINLKTPHDDSGILPKEKLECVRDTDCTDGQKCVSPEIGCKPLCYDVSCPNSETCDPTNGICASCCTAPYNGRCNGCSLACNKGYTLMGNVCIPDCTPPANGQCISGILVCNSGYTLKEKACVTDCVAPENGKCVEGNIVCNAGFKNIGDKCLLVCSYNVLGYCGEGLVCNDYKKACCKTARLDETVCDFDDLDAKLECPGASSCSSPSVCISYGGCNWCCPAGSSTSTLTKSAASCYRDSSCSPTGCPGGEPYGRCLCGGSHGMTYTGGHACTSSL